MIQVIWVQGGITCFDVMLNNLQWHSKTNAVVQMSVLKQERPQQMWQCNPSNPPITTSYTYLGIAIWSGECVCVWRNGESHTVAHSWDNLPCWFENSAPSWGSWNNDVTSEPQPGTDQTVDFLIKYLSAKGNYPASACLMVNCKISCWSSAENLLLSGQHPYSSRVRLEIIWLYLGFITSQVSCGIASLIF